MRRSLIINARHQLHWHHRLVSDAFTAMLWGGWLWLWRPVMGTFNWLSGVGANFHPTLMKLLGGIINLEGSAVMLAGTSGTLLLWRLLPSRTAHSEEAHDLGDYARHFQLPEQEVMDGRASSICVVHHDEHGRIIRIDSQPG